ncbi:MAG: ABC transporter permease, partial [Bacillota bacterium]
MKKLLLSFVTILCAMLLMFLAIQYMPGSPVDSLANEFVRTQNLEWSIAYQRAVTQLNYDPSIPVVQRLTRYLGNILRGNLGQSMIYQRPVLDIVLGALPWTLLIVTFALALSFTVGILLGIFIAWKRKRLLNAALTVYQSVFGSIPDYIIAYILVFIFAVSLGWFPSRGPYSAAVKPGPTWEFISSVLRHAVLPVTAYFITTVAGWTIGMRASSLSVLGEDYMSYAIARGLSRQRILISYLGRNAILPM